MHDFLFTGFVFLFGCALGYLVALLPGLSLRQKAVAAKAEAEALAAKAKAIIDAAEKKL